MTQDITVEDLNAGQRAALDGALQAIETKTHCTINGPAGTGKTTLTRVLIDHLIRSGRTGIMLAAPTHQAKKVLAKLAGMEASTIHSLLKINPTTYEDTTEFVQSDTPDLSECSVLICDEVSMYDRELFRILLASVPYSCTIIGLGDMAQIRPVAPGNNRPELSAFFFNEKFKQLHLTEVMRSNAPIIKVATEIRQGGWIRQELVDGEGVHDLTEHGKSVANFMGKYFEIVKDEDDLFDNRMLAFTNKSVDSLNGIIRKRLYQTTEPFIKTEVIVMQEPLMKTVTFEGKKFTETVFNNGELVRILECRPNTSFLSLKGSKFTDKINVWDLQVQGVDNGLVASFQVIVDEQESNKFQNFLSVTAGQFKENREVRPNWKGWWEVRSRFKKVKALPVGTIHKSQGSTVDASFVYTPCIHRCDAELAQQLLYVATTRARNNVYFI
ncbi:Dda-like helicase [Acinetobacter phage Acj9]|uniref:Dda DNA helicase n=1 Tax=Acinetobacter phage Acj9 TaxID=760939 RepID=E5EPF7_9CAUD|nr:Dda-like helicase [Acinetobacter phage Acj9]ADG59923.1 Dda DNA helicase [Acinetobacter phage Acj9]